MKKLLFLLLLLPLFAAAQYDSTKPLQYQNAYGFNWKNAKFRNSLILPHDTIQMAVADSGAIVWNSGGVYVWDGYVWGLSSGAGTDSSAFRFAEQLSDTSFALKSLLDSVTFIFEVEGAGFDIDSINAALSGKLNITDTAAMLSPYLRGVDTLNLSDRIDALSGGGSPTPKFPLVSQNDSSKLKLPPNSIAANLTSDTAEVQFVKIKRKTISVLSDTVRWVASTAVPTGTPEIYYRWSQLGSTVNLQIWAYYPNFGTGTSSAAINLPSDCPVPNYPPGWNIANGIIAEGTGGIYVNRVRTTNELGATSPVSVLRRNDDNTKWELVVKNGSLTARVAHWNINYETTDL